MQKKQPRASFSMDYSIDMPRAEAEAARRRSELDRQTSGKMLREEHKLVRLQKQSADEHERIYENRINLLQQRKVRALKALNDAARRQEMR